MSDEEIKKRLEESPLRDFSSAVGLTIDISDSLPVSDKDDETPTDS